MKNPKESGRKPFLGGRTTVKEPLPQAEQILGILIGTDPGSREKVIAASRGYESRYLAWENVRRQRAAEVVGRPYYTDRGKKVFLEPTGFEPYFAEQGKTSEQIISQEAALGNNLLRNLEGELRRRTRSQVEFDDAVSELKKFILGKNGLDATRVREYTIMISTILGATLGRLRVPTQSNNQLSAFRDETYRGINLSQIAYSQEGGIVVQEYSLPVYDGAEESQEVKVELSPRELEGYRVLANIGKFGHPLIRAAISNTKPLF